MILVCVSYVQMLVCSHGVGVQKEKGGGNKTEPKLVAFVPIPPLRLHERLLVGVVMVAWIFASDMQSFGIGWW